MRAIWILLVCSIFQFCRAEPILSYRTSSNLSNQAENQSSLATALENWRAKQQISPEIETVLIQQSLSLISRHFHYQFTVKHIPIEDVSLVISTDISARTVKRVYQRHVNRLKGVSIPLASKVIPTSERRIAAPLISALDASNEQNKLMSDLNPVWRIVNKTLVLNYKWINQFSKPQGEWVLYFNHELNNLIEARRLTPALRKTYANFYRQTEVKYDWSNTLKGEQFIKLSPKPSGTGSYLSASKASNIGTNQTEYLPANVQVFDPDPHTFLQDPELKDDSPDSAFQAAYQTKQLTQVKYENGRYILESPGIAIRDFDAPNIATVTSESGDFVFQRGEAGFDQSNVFFHLTQSYSYLESLGYSGEKQIFNRQVVADATALDGQDQSYFSSAQNRLIFGNGGVNDAEDADVILHEFGHAIQFAINSQWQGGDTGGIGEGFGDYWAGSYSASVSDFEKNKVFNWDGNGEFWRGRRLDDLDARYNSEKVYPAHALVDGTYSDQLWSTPLFQSLNDLMARGIPREQVDVLILESQFGLGSGITMPVLARSIVETATQMYPSGPHAEVFDSHFRHHNILTRPVNIKELRTDFGSNQVPDPGETISIFPLVANDSGFTLNASRLELQDNEVYQTSVNSVATFNLMPYQEVSIEQPLSMTLDAGLGCGEQITAPVKLQWQEYGKTVTGIQSFTWRLGEASFHRLTSQVETPIPDKGSAQVLTLEYPELGHIVNDLQVEVLLEHSWSSDISIKLISPQGSEVELKAAEQTYSDQVHFQFSVNSDNGEGLAALNDEPAMGEWQLVVQDEISGDSGKVIEWKLANLLRWQCIMPPLVTGTQRYQAGAGETIALEVTSVDPQNLSLQLDWQPLNYTSDFSTLSWQGEQVEIELPKSTESRLYQLQVTASNTETSSAPFIIEIEVAGTEQQTTPTNGAESSAKSASSGGAVHLLLLLMLFKFAVIWLSSKLSAWAGLTGLLK